MLQYIRERCTLRKMVDDATGVEVDDANQLLLQVAYGGAVNSWCVAHGVEKAKLPAFVLDFAAEQRETQAVDVEKHPELMEKIRAKGGGRRPDTTLQSYMNMRREREVLDAMEAAVRGLAVVGGYEHYGLFYATQNWTQVTRRLVGLGNRPCWRKSGAMSVRP